MQAETTQAVAETANEHDAAEQAIVFFDGVCGLCSSTVDFVMARDKHRRFVFAPLQGETAARELDSKDVESLKSIVLKQHDKIYRASSAIARILWRLGGIWSFLGALLWLIPWPIRHLCYKPLAAMRYRLFGKKETCRMPTPEERERFLP